MASPEQPTNTLAIVALTLGIAGFVILPLLPAIAAIICGAIALKQIRETGEKGHGMALAGLILGIVGTVIGILVIIVFVIIFGAVIGIIGAVAANSNFTVDQCTITNNWNCNDITTNTQNLIFTLQNARSTPAYDVVVNVDDTMSSCKGTLAIGDLQAGEQQRIIIPCANMPVSIAGDIKVTWSNEDNGIAIQQAYGSFTKD